MNTASRAGSPSNTTSRRAFLQRATAAAGCCADRAAGLAGAGAWEPMAQSRPATASTSASSARAGRSSTPTCRGISRPRKPRWSPFATWTRGAWNRPRPRSRMPTRPTRPAAPTRAARTHGDFRESARAEGHGRGDDFHARPLARLHGQSKPPRPARTSRWRNPFHSLSRKAAPSPTQSRSTTACSAPTPKCARTRSSTSLCKSCATVASAKSACAGRRAQGPAAAGAESRAHACAAGIEL